MGGGGGGGDSDVFSEHQHEQRDVTSITSPVMCLTFAAAPARNQNQELKEAESTCRPTAPCTAAGGESPLSLVFVSLLTVQVQTCLIIPSDAPPGRRGLVTN